MNNVEKFNELMKEITVEDVKAIDLMLSSIKSVILADEKLMNEYMYGIGAVEDVKED